MCTNVSYGAHGKFGEHKKGVRVAWSWGNSYESYSKLHEHQLQTCSPLVCDLNSGEACRQQCYVLFTPLWSVYIAGQNEIQVTMI